MKITKKQNGDSTILEIEGRVETATASELEAEINKVLSNSKELVLDFKNVEYISSAGLRVLLTAQKSVNANKGKMKIIHVNEVVNEVFDITGFTSILTIE